MIRRFLLCVLLASLIGCSARITRPLPPSDPVAVFVADYGRHSSILLPAGDDRLVEFAWGDYAWFAANHNDARDALAALFWSHGSTLGIRWLSAGPQSADLRDVVRCARLLRFTASRQKAMALRQQLAARIDRHLDAITYNPMNDFCFVRDDEPYALAHNCNHVTAHWLSELGCKIKGSAVLSHFTLEDAP